GAPLDGSGDTSAIEADPSQPTHIYRWNLARQFDAEGGDQPVNQVAYRYASALGTAYLTDVYDTPPAANAATAPLSNYAHHAHLAYETRTDATTSYRRGWAASQSLRLVGVDVASMAFTPGSARELVRRYHLTYNPNYHVSLLASVQMEGRSAGPI